MEFFGLYLSCTLVAVLLLMDDSTYRLLKVEMFVTVTKSSNIFLNFWVNPVLTFNCNTVQGKYICPPYKLQQIANHSYVFL